MTFADGLELNNGALAFAEHQNVELMAARGNQRISGVGVVAQGSPDMTVNIASGNVLAGGIVVAVSASATFAGVVAGGNVLFSTLQASLTSGQAVFVFIHVNSSGTITNTDGTPAAAGQQLPPDVPEDELVLAMLTLTEGDTTIDNVDIEDWTVNVPKGGYVAGAMEITGALTVGGAIIFSTPLTNSNIDVGIADNKIVEIDSASVGDGEYAKFTSNGLEGKTVGEVLSDIGAEPIDKISLAQCSPPNVEQGASLTTTFGWTSFLLPATDPNCAVSYHFAGDDRLSATTTLRVKCWYTMTVAGSAYSVEWSITRLSSGVSAVTSLGNVLDADTTHDFPSVSANVVGFIEFDVTDADIVADAIYQIQIQSDASNTNSLSILGLELIPIM